MSIAYHDINNSTLQIHKQIVKYLDSYCLDESIDAFENWFEDFGSGMSEDMEITDELYTIVKCSRDHIRIDDDNVRGNIVQVLVIRRYTKRNKSCT